MNNQSTTTKEAPDKVTLWICCHCQTPRMVGLTVCEKCHKRLHDTLEYARTLSPEPVAADAEEVADQVTVGWITDFTRLEVDGEAFRALAARIESALTAAADQQREVDAVVLTDEEKRVLSDHHYYEAEKAVTPRRDRAAQSRHLERLALFRAGGK